MHGFSDSPNGNEQNATKYQSVPSFSQSGANYHSVSSFGVGQQVGNYSNTASFNTPPYSKI